MSQKSRVRKSLLNARVNLIFYFLTLMLSFFSRKIFLNALGADFVGLTGTLQNLLGFLNLAELGIGAAVSFNLYKPIQEGNREKIVDLISVFGSLYRYIGLAIMGIAIILSCFLPLIFKNTIFDYGVIYFAFFSFLFSSLIGYFINYRQILLSADQKNYVVAGYFQTGNILKCIIQMYIAYYYANYYIWIAIELAFGILYSIILNKKIDKEYPWLKASIKTGNIKRKEYPEIIRYTRQIFVHKLKDFLLTQSDQILVFAFVSLKMVAYYGNYVLITSRLAQLLTTTLDSIGAGVGNLVAEGNRAKILNVFWELMFIRYLIAGIIVFSIYHLITPFISLWLGNEYILDQIILVLLLLNLFIMITRGTVDMFNGAYGNYGDIWAAWTEGGINLGITMIAASFWGISGILLGKILSLLPIIVFWKPYYLFKSGFREAYGLYWTGTIRYYIVFGCSFVILHFASMVIPINPYKDFYNLILYSCFLVFPFSIVYGIGLVLFTQGAKSAMLRVPYIKNIIK